jgi:predicted  nucleic acid-binding Zn-ribbon protein
MALAETVFHLEQLDSTLDLRVAALRDLQRRSRQNVELDNARTALASLEAERARVSAESRAADVALAEIEAHIARTRGRLYGGAIIDPRELSSLQRELDHLAPRRDDAEMRCLDLMERIETLDAQINSRRDEVARLEKAREESRPRAVAEARALNEQIAALRAEREPLASSLDPSSLALYTRLRAAQGHAVSPIANGICTACRVTLPPRDVQHARGSTLTTCPNCRRILYTPA